MIYNNIKDRPTCVAERPWNNESLDAAAIIRLGGGGDDDNYAECLHEYRSRRASALPAVQQVRRGASVGRGKCSHHEQIRRPRRRRDRRGLGGVLSERVGRRAPRDDDRGRVVGTGVRPRRRGERPQHPTVSNKRHRRGKLTGSGGFGGVAVAGRTGAVPKIRSPWTVILKLLPTLKRLDIFVRVR